MTRARKLGIDRPARPSGPDWIAFRKRLLSPGGAFWNKSCYLCGHQFEPGQHREIQHHIPPETRPDLAWNVSNLAVVHAAARGSFCSHCFIACNNVAAANPAVRDAQGRPLPFTQEFIARKSAEALAKHPERAGNRPAAGSSIEPSRPDDAAPDARGHYAYGPGRCWCAQCMPSGRRATLYAT